MSTDHSRAHNRQVRLYGRCETCASMPVRDDVIPNAVVEANHRAEAEHDKPNEVNRGSW